VNRAKKRYGQHFLHDPGTIERIVRAIDPRPGDRIVEVGPGRGAITVPLLAAAGSLDVIEIDPDVVPRLEERCAGVGHMQLHLADALEFDFRALRGDGPALRLVGNLPYNISTPLLFHFVAQLDAIASMHFMLQKEVVARMAAAPASKDYGRLTVMLQWRYHIEALFEVPPEAFEPPPRVTSAVVRMLPWPVPAALDAGVLETLVRVAFSQRRKLLRHTLGRWLEERRFGGAFDLQRRAEEVPVAEYVALAQAVHSGS
jgi:16S rRNA (adenine1518-N6/adenine1519-N6)-dimethyltransferase